MNNVVLVGRLTRDVELKYIQGSGTPVANFAIAVDREFIGKDGKKEVDFINIVVWDKLAENTKKYTSKGDLIGIEGRLQTRTYEASDGTKRVITEVLASNIQFLVKNTPPKDESKVVVCEEKINNGLPEEESVPW